MAGLSNFGKKRAAPFGKRKTGNSARKKSSMKTAKGTRRKKKQ